MKAFLSSFQGKLTLWSIVVIGVALTGFALALSYSNLQRLAQGIDRELQMRSERLGRSGGPPPQLRQGPQGQGSGVNRPQRQIQGFGGGGPGRGQGGPPPEMPPNGGDPQAAVFASLLRPRFIDLQGRSMGMPVGSSRVDLQACKLEYSIVSPK